MKKTPGIGIALDDFAALEIINDTYRIITGKSYAGAHKVYKKNGKVCYLPIRKSKEFVGLSELFRI